MNTKNSLLPLPPFPSTLARTRASNPRHTAGYTLTELAAFMVLAIILFGGYLQTRVSDNQEGYASSFGQRVSDYNRGVSEYLVDRLTNARSLGIPLAASLGAPPPGMPVGGFVGTDWLKAATCPGVTHPAGHVLLNAEGYLPCGFELAEPFYIGGVTTEIESVVSSVCTPPDPLTPGWSAPTECPPGPGIYNEVASTSWANTPTVQGDARVDLASDSIIGAREATLEVEGALQSFNLQDRRITANSRSVDDYLRIDGRNRMLAHLNNAHYGIFDAVDLRGTGDVTARRFTDADDNAFGFDPAGTSNLLDITASGNLAVDNTFTAHGRGQMTDTTNFSGDTDFNSEATFNGNPGVTFNNTARFYDGIDADNPVTFAANVNHLTRAEIENLNFNTSQTVGGSCSTGEIGVSAAGHIMECRLGHWQLAGTNRDGTLTYYTTTGDTGGRWQDIPGRHQFCSISSFEGDEGLSGSRRSIDGVVGGGAILQPVPNSADDVGAWLWQYRASSGSSTSGNARTDVTILCLTTEA